MLQSLQIKDYALIENIEVGFGRGLNIITGETGAGKSILIGALGLLLGERASTETIRKGSKKSYVEGIFDVSDNDKISVLLEKLEIDRGDELIIRREISVKGSNRCFLNDTPVTLNVIKEIGDLLIDLHGQHEHQSLLNDDTHIEMIDEIINVKKELNSFFELKQKLVARQNELNNLLKKESSIKEKKELYQFQLNEINSVSPEVGEEEKLLNELKILENSEKLIELTSEAFVNLYENENAVYDQLVHVSKSLIELSSIDESFKEKVEQCESALANINDIAEYLRSYKDSIEINPELLEEIRERLGSFNLLKKKYGGSIEAVIEHKNKIENEINIAENFDDEIGLLKNEIHKLRIECGKTAKSLSDKRKSNSEQIKNGVVNSLKNLGIENSVFEIRFNHAKANSDSSNFVIVEDEKIIFNDRGIDEIVFYISTNIGEDPKPLSRVASGGEISRIMLALKSILAKNDQLPLLVFDEIDTGISGRIGQKVGKALKDLAAFHQIIVITHLPQIAGLSDHHFFVNKKVIDNRVISYITKLDEEQKVKEIAKLMSGDNITEASISGAKELMGL
ncbi:MAG: DNA repair protein RecN [Ignavibacteria bacterium]|jgi:DNA repair protein RecN (Recombination protein N)